MNRVPELSPEERTRAFAAIPPPKKKRPPLTPGRLVYLTFHYPRQLWRDGFRWHYEAARGRRELAEAIVRTPKENEPAGNPVALHYLTGKRFIPLTSVALVSAQRTFGRPIAPVLHDDGSLRAEDVEALRQRFPRARIVAAAELAERLETHLPQAQFPFLRKIRLGYIHLRKLTDVHAGEKGPKVVLDSDVLFFRRPDELLRAIDAQQACFMQDCTSSYGAPVEALSSLAATPVHPTLNVGLYQLFSDKIDWEFVEHCAQHLIARHGFSYYLEQALTAILLAGAQAVPLSRDYVVYPAPEQARACREVAYHYVDRSYLLLYRYGWRQVLALPRA